MSTRRVGLVLVADSITKTTLRKHGWVPFMQLNDRSVWVGPNGELETQSDAIFSVLNKK